MKRVRFAVIAAILMTCVITYGQSSTSPATVSDSQKSFDRLKTLAGTWQGTITTDNPAWSTDKPMPLTIRVASRGNALIHELNTGGPEITVLYLQDDRIVLMHYCDFGNRPHMVAKPSADNNTLEFDLADFTGSDAIGHVTRGAFTIIDADHHTEDWTFLPAGSKPVHAHIDFKRVQ